MNIFFYLLVPVIPRITLQIPTNRVHASKKLIVSKKLIGYLMKQSHCEKTKTLNCIEFVEFKIISKKSQEKKFLHLNDTR